MKPLLLSNLTDTIGVLKYKAKRHGRVDTPNLTDTIGVLKYRCYYFYFFKRDLFNRYNWSIEMNKAKKWSVTPVI